MSTQAKIKIHGKTYTLKNDASGVDIEEVGAYVDAKMRELSSGKTPYSPTDLAVLTALNIAGELLAQQRELKALKKESGALRQTAEENSERAAEALEREKKIREKFDALQQTLGEKTKRIAAALARELEAIETPPAPGPGN